jgi:hypothetical protein
MGEGEPPWWEQKIRVFHALLDRSNFEHNFNKALRDLEAQLDEQATAALAAGGEVVAEDIVVSDDRSLLLGKIVFRVPARADGG